MFLIVYQTALFKNKSMLISFNLSMIYLLFKIIIQNTKFFQLQFERFGDEDLSVARFMILRYLLGRH